MSSGDGSDTPTLDFLSLHLFNTSRSEIPSHLLFLLIRLEIEEFGRLQILSHPQFISQFTGPRASSPYFSFHVVLVQRIRLSLEHILFLCKIIGLLPNFESIVNCILLLLLAIVDFEGSRSLIGWLSNQIIIVLFGRHRSRTEYFCNLNIQIGSFVIILIHLTDVDSPIVNRC